MDHVGQQGYLYWGIILSRKAAILLKTWRFRPLTGRESLVSSTLSKVRFSSKFGLRVIDLLSKPLSLGGGGPARRPAGCLCFRFKILNDLLLLVVVL